MPKVAARDYDPQVLSRTLREFRDKLALNQAEMAALVGISKSLLAKLELGTAVTSSRTIRLLAEGIGTTESYLTTGKGNRVAPPKPRTDASAGGGEAGVPDEKTIQRILELAAKPEILALAQQSAETLQLQQSGALAMIIRAMLMERR